MTRTSGERTGFPNTRCYAAPLADCSQDVDKEHYISESVLESLGDGRLEIGGLPWQRGETRAMYSATLTARVLCRRHNNALSPLDSVAARFFRTLRSFERTIGKPERDGEAPAWSLFNGHDVERWLLKVLLGMLAAKSITHPAGQVLLGGTEEKTLRVLFGELSMPEGCGLYVAQPSGVVESRVASLRITPFFSDAIVTPELAGLRLETMGLSLILSLHGRIKGMKDANYERVESRPDFIAYTDGELSPVIRLTWDGGRSGRAILGRHVSYRAGEAKVPSGPSRRQKKRSRRR